MTLVKSTRLVISALLFIVLMLAVSLAYVYQKFRIVRSQASSTQSISPRAYAHYMDLYKVYAATERHRQYGFADQNVEIFFNSLPGFVPIESVTEKLICPKPVKEIPNGFTFYGARNIVLGRKNALPLLYSMSYYGNTAFIRDHDWFDSLLDLGALGDGNQILLPESRAANLMNKAPKPLTRNGSYFTPFSFNTADLNMDGTQDFMFGGRLFLSNKGGGGVSADR